MIAKLGHGFFPDSVSLVSSAIVKVLEQVGAAKIRIPKVPRFLRRGSQTRLPKVQEEVPKGSQARFPKGSRKRFPKVRESSQARFPSQVPKPGSRALKLAGHKRLKCQHVENIMQTNANERLEFQNCKANAVQNGRRTWQHVANTMQNGR